MIDYEIKKSTRARHMRITIDKHGAVFVTVPQFMLEQKAHEFVEEKKVWLERSVKKMKGRAAAWLGIKIPIGNAKDFKQYKNQALHLVNEKLSHFNTFYHLSWNSVSIRNTKSRWGSCSKRRNLNFNYRVVFLPPHLADYLIVHELCHLQEFNHSKNFWKIVEKTIPDYKRHRKLLKLL